MGDEHLDTIPATESDEAIKSSVEDLVPIPSESEGIPDTMCDVHLVNNPTPLEAKDHFEIVINSNDDYSSSDDDSLYYKNIEYVEASPHDSELVSIEVEKIVIPKDEEIEDDNLREKWLKRLVVAVPLLILIYLFIEEIRSGSTTTQSDISLHEYDSFIFDLSNDQFPPTDMSDFTHEEFGNEPAHIISPPEYECFYFGNLPDSSELISSLNSGIRENLSYTTRVNLPVEDDHSPLLACCMDLSCLSHGELEPINPTSLKVDQSYLDSEGDILLLEDFLNDDPSLPPPIQGNYPPKVYLPPHLEYAFLEGDDKLPVIIAKDLSVEEKTALITVLKLHKRAIAWKLSDIKGI
nr:reverse transcriptase domain-containing protein [Tanacetum cinerariifolium]